MNDLYLTTVTLSGLHYKRTGKGGGDSAPLPFPVEADAYAGSWDAETSTLSWFVPAGTDADGFILDPTPVSYVVSSVEIADGITHVTTPKPPSVPQRVSKLALAKAIYVDSGKRLMSLPDLVPVEMRGDTEEFLVLSAYIDRDHPQIEPLAALLGYGNPEQVDAIFILANSIEV